MYPGFLRHSLARYLENLGQGAMCFARAQIQSWSCEQSPLQTEMKGVQHWAGLWRLIREPQGGGRGLSPRQCSRVFSTCYGLSCTLLLSSQIKHPFLYGTPASLGKEIIFVLLS